MTDLESKILCIYCKKYGDPSREHLLQKSLGGNLTAKFVCKGCNNGFSVIDQALATSSLLSFTRIVEQTTDAAKVKMEGFHTYIPPGTTQAMEIEVGHRFGSKLKPQMTFDGGKIGGGFSSNDDRDRFLKVLRNYKNKSQFDQIAILKSEKDVDGYTLPHLVLHRDKELYLRFPNGEADVESKARIILKMVNDNLDQIESSLRGSGQTPQHDPNPQITMRSSFHINNIYRAIAKTAFNLLALHEGQKLVLREEFDPIRNYILGTNIQDETPTPDSVAHDPRFVRSLKNEDLGSTLPRAQKNKHLVLIHYTYPEVIVGIDFYGQHYYLVKCGEIEHSDHMLHFHEFDYIHKDNKKLELVQAAELIRDMVSKKAGPPQG